MPQETSTLALALIIVGALLSLGREYLTAWYIKIYTWRTKRQPDERLSSGVRTYLMLTGMVFTLVGLLGLFGLLHF